jgi:carbonic anhydrase/acetyltransferase-like protein (isoleucine patch superfamily)
MTGLPGKCGVRAATEQLRATVKTVYLPSAMIRPYKGVTPTVPSTCYVDVSAQLIGDVVLGEHASVWMNAVLRGDVHSIRIGANSNVQDNSVLHGMLGKFPVIVGEWVTIGHSVTLHGCSIGDRCLIGMGSIILNNAKIGDGCIIAAGTLIPENTVVPSGTLWLGSPGKQRRELTDADQQEVLRYAKNYLSYKETYLHPESDIPLPIPQPPKK